LPDGCGGGIGVGPAAAGAAPTAGGFAGWFDGVGGTGDEGGVGSLTPALCRARSRRARQIARPASAAAVVRSLDECHASRMESQLLARITIEPGKCGGRPCIRGQRLRVSDVLDLLGHGASFEEVLRDYPFLEREDILAAMLYAARQTDHVVLDAS
jgi:uncharacterized protein (DUF433 family)